MLHTYSCSMLDFVYIHMSICYTADCRGLEGIPSSHVSLLPSFLSLQIHLQSLWFQTNNSWPDLPTTWLFLRTDKQSTLFHHLPHHLWDTQFYRRNLWCPGPFTHIHLSCFSDGATIFLLSVLLLELVSHSDVEKFPNCFTCTTFTSTLEYDIAVNIVNYCFSAEMVCYMHILFRLLVLFWCYRSKLDPYVIS